MPSVALEEILNAARPGVSLEQQLYTSDAIFRQDLDLVFGRNWLYAGHLARIPRPGDYFTFELGTESLIIIRSDQDQIHAVWNVCRHRGSRICTEPAGSARTLVCPYHQWAYARDGRLLKARLMQDATSPGRYDLARAEVRILEGLIFVHLGDETQDFAEFQRLMEPRLRHHVLESARLAHLRTYEIKANWKLVLENSRECYHCGAGHPQYCRAVGFAAAIGSPDLAQQDARLRQLKPSSEQDPGIESAEVPFTPHGWYHFRRFRLRSDFVTESMDGRAVAPLMGSLPGWDTGSFAIVTLPNLLLEANSDYVMTLRITPAGPQRTLAEVCWFVHGDAREGIDYDVDRLTEFWRLTSEQDWKLCEDNQLGVNSSRYVPGPYGPDERGVEHFVRWYLHQLQPRQER